MVIVATILLRKHAAMYLSSRVRGLWVVGLTRVEGDRAPGMHDYHHYSSYYYSSYYYCSSSHYVVSFVFLVCVCVLSFFLVVLFLRLAFSFATLAYKRLRGCVWRFKVFASGALGALGRSARTPESQF